MKIGIGVQAVVPGYYLVCYNSECSRFNSFTAVVPGYYLVCYNFKHIEPFFGTAVVPGYYLVCYNPNTDKIR